LQSQRDKQKIAGSREIAICNKTLKAILFGQINGLLGSVYPDAVCSPCDVVMRTAVALAKSSPALTGLLF
jgi:hypothetical protein